MTVTAPGRAPSTDAELIRSFHDRIRALELKPSVRVGPWSLVDVDGVLTAMKPGTSPVNLLAPLTAAVPGVGQAVDTLSSLDLTKAVTGGSSITGPLQMIADFLSGKWDILDQFGIDLSSATGLISGLASLQAKILTALTGISLDDPGSVLNAIGAAQEAFAQALFELLGKFPFIGSYLQSLAMGFGQTIDAALAAIRTATANQQIISTPGSQSSWAGLIAGFFTFPLGSARDTDLLTVNSTTSYGGFITPGESSPIAGLITAVKKVGTVTTANMDLYKLTTAGPNAGLLTRLWSSPDFASLITSGADPALVQLDFPDTVALISAPTDVFMAILRMTGAGSISAVGYGTNNVAAPTGYFPTKPGLVRNPTTTAAPDTIAPAAVAPLYSNQRPFMQMARYAQSTDPGAPGPVEPPAPLRKFADAFNRSYDYNRYARLGADWTSERHSTDVAWAPVNGYLGIHLDSMQFGPEPLDSVNFGSGRQGSLYKYAAGSNSARVGALFNPASWGSVPSGVVFCAAADWSRWAGVFVSGTAVEIRVGTSFDSYTPVKTFPISLPLGGAKPYWLWIGYDETINTFTAYTGPDGGTVIGSWVDINNQVIHDSSHRFGGAYLQYTGSSPSALVEEWHLEDLVAGTPDGTAPPPPPPSGLPVINRFIDLQNKQDGAFPDPAWKQTTNGAGGAFLTVKNGAGVMLSSGTAPAACYSSIALTDNAVIKWGIAGYKFTDNATAAVGAFIWWSVPFPVGLNQNLQGVKAQVHIVLYPTGYVVQIADTTISGGPVFNIGGRVYPVAPLAGAIHNMEVTYEKPGKPANTFTVVGADGQSHDYTHSGFGLYNGIEGCMELLDNNPATDREEAKWLYSGFDSVIGGRIPPSTPFIGTTKKVVMAAVAVMNSSGQFAGFTKPVTLVALGVQSQLGVFTAVTKPVVMEAETAPAITGTATFATKPVVMVAVAVQTLDGAFAGSTKPVAMAATATHGLGGSFAGSTKPVAMAATATMGLDGTFAGSTKPVAMAATGVHGETGTFTGSTKPVAMAATATHGTSGTFAGSTKPVAMAATGAVTSGASFSDDFNRADAATLGAAWTARSNNLKIVSNVAVPDTLSAFCLDSYNTDFNTDNHKVTAKINAAPVGTELVLLYVRSNNTDSQLYAYCLNGGQWIIYSKASTYNGSLATPTQRAITAGVVSFTAADDISLEVTGTGASAVFTVKKNGASVGLSFTDTGSAIPSGATHRGWAVGYLATNTGHGIDSVTAADI